MIAFRYDSCLLIARLEASLSPYSLLVLQGLAFPLGFDFPLGIFWLNEFLSILNLYDYFFFRAIRSPLVLDRKSFFFFCSILIFYLLSPLIFFYVFVYFVLFSVLNCSTLTYVLFDDRLAFYSIILFCLLCRCIVFCLAFDDFKNELFFVEFSASDTAWETSLPS